MRRKRNSFRVWPSPDKLMSPVSAVASFPTGVRPAGQLSPDLVPFTSWFERKPDARERFRWVLRDSLDELLDGQRTGRWAYQHLSKTERTHLGTVVEVNLTKEFSVPDGDDLDWEVAGADLDCKFSKDLGGWEIPMEMYLCPDHGEASGKADHPALLVWMNDDTSQWAAGLLRMSDANLRWKKASPDAPLVRAYNRDNKRKIGEAARADIVWLWGGIAVDLPANTLLHLAPTMRERIFANRRSGQARVDALFESVQDQLISRAVVLTVAQQEDAPKRVRDARINLRDRGIVVLGHQDSHPVVARALDLPIPEKGEWISTRLVRVLETDPRPRVRIDGYSNVRTGVFSESGVWARALPEDPAEPGPVLNPGVSVSTP